MYESIRSCVGWVAQSGSKLQNNNKLRLSLTSKQEFPYSMVPGIPEISKLLLNSLCGGYASPGGNRNWFVCRRVSQTSWKFIGIKCDNVCVVFGNEMRTIRDQSFEEFSIKFYAIAARLVATKIPCMTLDWNICRLVLNEIWFQGRSCGDTTSRWEDNEICEFCDMLEWRFLVSSF